MNKYIKGKDSPDNDISVNWGLSQEISNAGYSAHSRQSGENDRNSSQKKNKMNQERFQFEQDEEDEEANQEEMLCADVMEEIENYVKPKKRKQKANHDEEDVYEMCDQFLQDLSYLDSQLDNRESHNSSIQNLPL